MDVLLAILLNSPPDLSIKVTNNYRYNHAKIKLAISMGVYGDREINRVEFLQ